MNWTQILKTNNMNNKLIIKSNNKVFWELDKKNNLFDLSSFPKNNKFRIINFNLLATAVSNFKTYDHKKESGKMIELRYNNIAKILLYFMHTNIDIINLQELDGSMYLLLNGLIKLYNLPYKLFFNNYFIKKKKLNFRGYDVGIIVNIKKYKILKCILKNITPQKILNENSLYTTKRSKKAFFCEIQNKINNKKIAIISTHLSGQPQRPDIRIEELNTIIKFIKNNLNVNFTFITGDFNDQNYESINKIVLAGNLSIYKKYVNNLFTATSFHKINLIRETQKFEIFDDIDIFQTIDYLVSNINEKKINHIMMPHPINGIYGYENPYNDIIKINDHNYLENKNVWPSDHALIEFIINLN